MSQKDLLELAKLYSSDEIKKMIAVKRESESKAKSSNVKAVKLPIENKKTRSKKKITVKGKKKLIVSNKASID